MSQRPRSTAKGFGPTPFAEWIGLGAILLLGLLIRASYFGEIVRAPDFSAPPADAGYHDYWARGLVTGNWTPPEGQADPEIRTRPFARPPGYPYFLALVYRLGGPDFHRPRVVQMAIGLASVVVGYFLGRSVFGSGVGLLYALLLSIYWGFTFYEGELQEPVLLVILMLLALLLLIRWRERPRASLAAGAGLALGLASIVRPNMLFLVAAAILWTAWLGRRRKEGGRTLGRAAAPLALGVAVAIAPVTARNMIVSGERVLISCNGAISLYVGNNPTSDGISSRIPDLPELTGASGWSWYQYPSIAAAIGRQAGKPMSYSDVSSYFSDKAKRFIRENPGRVLGLMVRKTFLFWGPVEVSNNKVDQLEWTSSKTLHLLPGFPMALSLCVLGLALFLLEARAAGRNAKGVSARLAAQKEVLVLIVLFTGLYFVSFLPFIVAGRFRLAVVPLLLLFAAYAVHRVASWARAGRVGAALAATGAAVGLFAIAQARLVPYEPDSASWHIDRAAAYDRRGLLQQAADEYRAALLDRPEHPEALMGLGGALVRLGQTQDGLRQYRKVAAAAPGLPEPHYKLALLLTDLGRPGEAIPEYQAALRVGPKDAALLYDLGRACSLTGRNEEAAEAYKEALRLRPRFLEAEVNLGAALFALGRAAEAEAACRRALVIDPRFPLAHLHLGNALAAQARIDEALAEYRAALAAEPRLEEARMNVALALLAKGENDEGIVELRTLLRGNPRNVAAWRSLANAQAQEGRIDEAIASLREASENVPSDMDIRRDLAEMESRAGRPRQAPRSPSGAGGSGVQ